MEKTEEESLTSEQEVREQPIKLNSDNELIQTIPQQAPNQGNSKKYLDNNVSLNQSMNSQQRKKSIFSEKKSQENEDFKPSQPVQSFSKQQISQIQAVEIANNQKISKENPDNTFLSFNDFPELGQDKEIQIEIFSTYLYDYQHNFCLEEAPRVSFEVKYQKEIHTFQVNLETFDDFKSMQCIQFATVLPASFSFKYVSQEQNKQSFITSNQQFRYLVKYYMDKDEQNQSNILDTQSQLNSGKLIKKEIAHLEIIDNQKLFRQEVLQQVQFFGTEILVVKGDLTEEASDGIVNAANEMLQLGAGVAGAIRKKDYPSSNIQKECDAYIADIGELEPGQAVVTTGGLLKAQYVIHAVGPVWEKGLENQKISELIRCIRTSIILAIEKKMRVISFPAISSGIFGFPKLLCAKVFLIAIKQTLFMHNERNVLKQIRLTNIDDQTCEMFQKESLIFSQLYTDRLNLISNFGKQERIQVLRDLVQPLVMYLPDGVYEEEESIQKKFSRIGQVNRVKNICKYEGGKIQKQMSLVYYDDPNSLQFMGEQSQNGQIQFEGSTYIFSNCENFEVQDKRNLAIYRCFLKGNHYQYIEDNLVFILFNENRKQIFIYFDQRANSMIPEISRWFVENQVLNTGEIDLDDSPESGHIATHVLENIYIFHKNFNEYLEILKDDKIDRNDYSLYITGVEPTRNRIFYTIFKKKPEKNNEQFSLKNLFQAFSEEKAQGFSEVDKQTIQQLQKHLKEFLEAQKVLFDTKALNLKSHFENKQQLQVSHLFYNGKNVFVGLDKDIQIIEDIVEEIENEHDLNLQNLTKFKDNKLIQKLQFRQQYEEDFEIPVPGLEKKISKEEPKSRQNMYSKRSQNDIHNLKNKTLNEEKKDEIQRQVSQRELQQPQAVEKREKGCCQKFSSCISFQYNKCTNAQTEVNILVPPFISSLDLHKVRRIVDKFSLIPAVQATYEISREQELFLKGNKNSIIEIQEILENSNYQYECQLSHHIKKPEKLQEIDYSKLQGDLPSSMIKCQSKIIFYYLEKKYSSIEYRDQYKCEFQFNSEQYQIQVKSLYNNKVKQVEHFIQFDIKNMMKTIIQNCDISDKFDDHELKEITENHPQWVQNILENFMTYFNIQCPQIGQMGLDNSPKKQDQEEKEKEEKNEEEKEEIKFDKIDFYQFQYKNDSSGFSDYNREQNDQIMKGYFEYEQDKTNKKICQITIVGKSYDIDFDKMTQVNTSTKYSRDMKKELLQWKMEDKSGKKVEIKKSSSFQQEIGKICYFFKKNLQDGQPIRKTITINKKGQKVKLLLRIPEFDMINQDTSALVYKFKLEKTQGGNYLQQQPQQSTLQLSQDVQKVQQKFVIKQTPLPAYKLIANSINQDLLDKAINQMKNNLNGIIDTYKKRIPICIQDDFLQHLNDLVYQYKLVPGVPIIQKGKEYTFKGFQSIIQEIKGVLDYVKDIDFKDGAQITYPKEWQSGQFENCKLYELSSTDPEYIENEKLFKNNHSRTVKSIKRIQNKILWQNYFLEKKKMVNDKKELLGLNISENEHQGWHGTKSTDPAVLYNGNTGEGFDVTYSNKSCMWGPGIYFAKESKYSDSYAYSSGGQKHLLLCKVAMGQSKFLSSDSTLNKPPLLDTGKPNGGRYDSVSGNTSNSDIYILYQMNVRRAYPAYLVSYV